MKKKLITDSIANELEGASLFFTKPAPPPLPPEPEKIENSVVSSPAPEKPVRIEKPKKIVNIKKPKIIETEKHDTVIPRHHDTIQPRYQDTMQPQIHGVMIDVVRKAVKEFGKEAATHRFTVAEKREIADLIYTYKNRGIKTSENEIARVAVNFIVEDYKVNGENSVLHKILNALNE